MCKKYFMRTIVAAMVIVLAGCGTSTTTSSNEQATTEQTTHRLVATTSAVTNIFEALDLDLVGVPTTTNEIPARYKGAVEVGNPMSPDVEVIASLQPTEVFSVTSLQTDLEPAFEQVNIPATFVNLQGLQQMTDAILDIGARYDRQKQATQLIESLQQEIEQLSASVEGKEKPKVLILFGIPGSYLVATENSYIGDLVRLAGGENVTFGAEPEYLASNTEYLQQSNPDVILRMAHGMPEQVVEMFNEEFKTNDIWKHFNAVQRDRVYDLEEPLFGTTATLEVTTALKQLIEILYP